MKKLAAFVGWDWADSKHALTVREPGRTEERRLELPNKPEQLHDWALQMIDRYEAQPIGVCIENSRGAVIGALMHYPHVVFYPVNPKSAQSFRETFHPSGKKDDPVDSDLLCDLLAKHQERLRCLSPTDEATRLLGLLSEHRRKLVGEKTRTTNRLRDALKMYFPQALELAGELDTAMACDFLDRWPTLSALKRAKAGTIEKFYRSHNSRSQELITTRLELIGDTVALTHDHALNRCGELQVTTLVPMVRTLIEAIRVLDQELAQIYQQHPEHEVIDSLPGVGEVIGPRLIAILGSDRTRFTSREELQLITGIAPVTSQSGKDRSVHRRLKRSKFMHQTAVEWASHAARSEPWAKAMFEAQKTAGKSTWSAYRAISFKLLRILYRCWADRVQYDSAVYEASLARRGSPYASRTAA